VSRYTFSPHSKVLASGDENGTIALWDTETGKNLSNLTRHTKRISALAFSADSKTLASGSYDGTIFLWDTEKLK